jgi:hypothetical protein
VLSAVSSVKSCSKLVNKEEANQSMQIRDDANIEKAPTSPYD